MTSACAEDGQIETNSEFPKTEGRRRAEIRNPNAVLRVGQLSRASGFGVSSFGYQGGTLLCSAALGVLADGADLLNTNCIKGRGCS